MLHAADGGGGRGGGGGGGGGCDVSGDGGGGNAGNGSPVGGCGSTCAGGSGGSSAGDGDGEAAPGETGPAESVQPTANAVAAAGESRSVSRAPLPDAVRAAPTTDHPPALLPRHGNEGNADHGFDDDEAGAELPQQPRNLVDDITAHVERLLASGYGNAEGGAGEVGNDKNGKGDAGEAGCRADNELLLPSRYSRTTDQSGEPARSSDDAISSSGDAEGEAACARTVELTCLATVRALLDTLLAIGQKLPLRTSTRLSALLARPHCLRALISLLEDTAPPAGLVPELVSSPTSPAAVDAAEDAVPSASADASSLPLAVGTGASAKSPATYAPLVAHIIAYGSQELRHNLLSSPDLLPDIFSILLRDPVDPIVAAHVVAVLESFLEYSPLPLLQHMASRPSFVSALLVSIHVPAVASLLSSIVPPRTDDAFLGSSNILPVELSPQVAFGMKIFAAAALPTQLANAFARAASQVLQNRVAIPPPTSQVAYLTLQRLNNAADVFTVIMTRLLPSFRIPLDYPEAGASQNPTRTSQTDILPPVLTSDTVDPSMDLSAMSLPSATEMPRVSTISNVELIIPVAESDGAVPWAPIDDILRNRQEQFLSRHALNVFENPAAASALGAILDAGMSTFTASNFTCNEALYASINCAVRLLDAVVAERGQRVSGLGAQPRPVATSALDGIILSRIPSLIEILLDTARSAASAFGRVRIMDLIVAAQRVCPSPVIYGALDRVRFSEVAYKLMCLHPRCSVLHVTVSASVEEALLANDATQESCAHWLVRGRLIQKILAAWARDGGALNWADPCIAQGAPYLSAVIHMACCVMQLRAMDADRVSALVGAETLAAFTAFCTGPLTVILQAETRMLGGRRAPRRRSENGHGSGVFGRPVSSSSLFGRSSSRTGAQHTRASYRRTRCASVSSPCAHRFGYVPAPSRITGRARAFRLGRVFRPRSAEDELHTDPVDGGHTGLPSAGLHAVEKTRATTQTADDEDGADQRLGAGYEDYSDEDSLDDFDDDDDRLDEFGTVLAMSSSSAALST